ACRLMVEHLPHFMNPIHWVDVYLCNGDEWSHATGSSANATRPPEHWLYYLDKKGYPPSVQLPREALEGTLFAQAGMVLLFPMRKQHTSLGLVVVATETETEAVGRDLVETLVTHTASAVFNAVQWEKEHQRSITDGLTGVYNRRFFNQRLHEEQEKGERYQRPFSLILLDIDHFKQCNDILGHLAGDALLKDIAAILREHTRKVDIVARYGGEEFAVILPETAFEGARLTADKLRSVVEQFPFHDQDQLPSGNVTASFGFSTFPMHGPTAEDLIHFADEALYSAKQAGRNRVGAPPYKS
ncbi:MAG: GGDEF domain-containing protein, partial [Cyanobacteria bacterium REEB65]|nr:GGDEF domain-containing protein [Cyanobacteria bacterium REEB65]